MAGRKRQQKRQGHTTHDDLGGDRGDAGHPITDVRPPKRIEDARLLVLAGPIAENLHCSVNPQDYPQEFAHAYDRLLDLPDTSPLVASDDDLRLTAIQDLI